jgi:hypothetical protein
MREERAAVDGILSGDAAARRVLRTRQNGTDARGLPIAPRRAA